MQLRQLSYWLLLCICVRACVLTIHLAVVLAASDGQLDWPRSSSPMDAQLDETDTYRNAAEAKRIRHCETVLPLLPVRSSSDRTSTAAGDVSTVTTRDPEAAASFAPSSVSSKNQWQQQKRHVCERLDCGKSFDSKWALIRCVSSGTVNADASRKRNTHEGGLTWTAVNM